MPLKKSARAIRAKIEQGQQEQLDRGLPAGAIRDQLKGASLPPGGNTGSGYSPAPHAHPLTDLAQSGATDGQVIAWSDGDSAYIPADAGGGGGGLTNPMTTAGDLIVGATGGTPDRLAVGSEDDVLTVVGGVPAWAPPTGGGGTDLWTLIYDTIANGTDDPIDAKIVSGAYVVLIFFKGNNTSGWSSPTNARHTVTSGKRFIVVDIRSSDILQADTSSRRARLQNVTDGTTIIDVDRFAPPYGGGTVPYSGDGGAATVLRSAAATKAIELQLWNTDSTKRAMGAIVLGKEV